MDKLIDKRFERLEKALATLINSISTYNPNPNLANDLVTADAELSEGLEQLTTHQSNHAKIIALRATSATLDTQIREALTLLVNTRREVLATPTSTFPENIRPVSNDDLLAYASRISKYTIPPNYREPDTQTSGEAGTNTPKEPQSQAQTNGSTPIIAANGITSEPASILPPAPASSAMDIDQSQPGAITDTQTTDTTGTASNAEMWKSFFDTVADAPFVPWPNEDIIRRGALAQIQMLVDQGIDPWTFDPEKSAELAADMKRMAEEEDAAREFEKSRAEEERRREMERRMSTSGEAGMERREEAPKVFQLEDFEDDDDDD